MRSLLAFVLLISFSAAAVAQVPTIVERPPTEHSPTDPGRERSALPRTSPLTVPQESRLDRLYGELRREGDPRAARRIAGSIQGEWTKSGSASVDLMMQWSQDAIDAKKFDVALDFLDQVTLLKPDFAEGWNRRASVHHMMNSYAKAMRDIERTLDLEPRHFGALAGMASIFKAYDRKQAALNAYQRVLTIYPALRDAQQELGRLADELAGQGI